MQSNSIKEVQDFFNSDEKDKIIEIRELANKSEQKIKELNLNFLNFSSFRSLVALFYFKFNRVAVS